MHTWRADEGVVPPPSNRCHLHLGGRSHQQGEVAPKRRQAVTFIAGYTLPGTAIFTIVRSSRLFVMLKRLIGGVGTEQGGGGEKKPHMASGLKYVPSEFFPFCRFLNHT